MAPFVGLPHLFPGPSTHCHGATTAVARASSRPPWPTSRRVQSSTLSSACLPLQACYKVISRVIVPATLRLRYVVNVPQDLQLQLHFAVPFPLLRNLDTRPIDVGRCKIYAGISVPFPLSLSGRVELWRLLAFLSAQRIARSNPRESCFIGLMPVVAGLVGVDKALSLDLCRETSFDSRDISINLP